MNNKGFISFIALLVGAAVLTAGVFAYNGLKEDISSVNNNLGSTLNIAGTNYYLSGSGISSSATSITLTSLTMPQTSYEILDANLSDTFYVTLEPGSRTRQEIVSCTTVTQNAGDTATLSGCTRGLLPFSPYTASTTYQFAHAGGATMVFSNPPQFYETFAQEQNTASITAVWTFASTTMPRLDSYLAPTFNYQLASKGYVDSVVTGGAADAFYDTKGLLQMATTSQLRAGTTLGSTSAYLSVPNLFFNVTSTATTIVPVTDTDGKLSQGFIDLTEAFVLSGNNTYSGTSLFSATSTFNGNLLANGSANTMATTTFSVIPTLPAATPTVGTQAVNKTYADTKTTGFISAYETRANNTVYNATTSGIIIAYAQGDSGSTLPTLNVYVDSNATPTTLLFGSMANWTANDIRVGATVPVPSGLNWYVVGTGNDAVSVKWIPFSY